MRTRLLKIFGLVVALALVAGACSKKTPTTSGTTTPPTTATTTTPTATTTETAGTITIGSDTANDHGTKTVSGNTIDVEADDFYFEPTVIKGTPGAQIKLMIKNDSQMLHNFTLQAQGIDEDIQPDATQPVDVTIPQSGFVEFFCKYHKASGMVGELTV